MLNEIFLESAKKQFQGYKSLAEKSFNQLSPDQFHWSYNDESNSIAIIIQHMYGNMMSRWTDFLTTDGEKDWRDRDKEFIINDYDKSKLIELWEKGWNCVFNTLNSLTPNDFEKKILIRGEELIVIDAITRQIAHYASHVGQIIYVAKMIRNKDWKTLSIPKGKSAEFNKDFFESHKNK